MTLAEGDFKLRSSCARPSVRDLTAALDALYAVLPLNERYLVRRVFFGGR